PWTAARRAPRALQLPSGRKLMYAAVPVAVRYVEVTPRTHGNVSGAVEGAAPTCDSHEILAVVPRIRRCVHDPQGQEQPALGRKLPDGVVAIIRAEDRAVGADGDAVGAGRELALAPRAHKVALVVVYHDRVVPTADKIYAVLAVHGHSRHVPRS